MKWDEAFAACCVVSIVVLYVAMAFLPVLRAFGMNV